MYLKTYHEAEYTELKALLKHQSELYSEAYGFGQIDRSYAKEKRKSYWNGYGSHDDREVKQYARSMKKATEQQIKRGRKKYVSGRVAGMPR